MQFSFDMTLDDHWAFQRQFHSVGLMRRWFVKSLVTALLSSGAAGWLLIQGNQSGFPAANALSQVALIVAGFTWILAYLLFKQSRSLKKPPESRKNDTLAAAMMKTGFARLNLGPTTISIEPEGLVEENRLTRTDYLWEAIDRVEETESYLFLRLINEIQAVTLPKRALGNTAVQAVVEAVKTHIAAAKAASPAT